MKFRVTFVRHGETDSNLNKVLQGQMNPPLNVTGQYQANALGRALSDEKFNRVICSDLKRAFQTCELALKINNHVRTEPIEVDAILRERNYGEFEGKELKEFLSRTKQEKNFTPEGGESLEQVGVRVEKFFSHLCSTTPDQSNVLVVSHGFYLNLLFRYLSSTFGCQHQDRDLAERLFNASRTCFDVTVPSCGVTTPSSGVVFTSGESNDSKLNGSANDWKEGAIVKCVYYNQTDY